MGQPLQHPRTARGERRAIVALLAVFALLVQALAPGMATASPLDGAGAVICTEMGLQSAPSGDGSGLPAAHPSCQHCVCPPLSAMPPPAEAVTRIAYAAFAGHRPEMRRDLPPPAHAPPRPPGQGPPIPNA